MRPYCASELLASNAMLHSDFYFTAQNLTISFTFFSVSEKLRARATLFLCYYQKLNLSSLKVFPKTKHNAIITAVISEKKTNLIEKLSFCVYLRTIRVN